MANKVRASYRVEPEIKRMIVDIATRRNMSETTVLEIAVKVLHGNQSVLDALYPELPTPAAPVSDTSA